MRADLTLTYFGLCRWTIETGVVIGRGSWEGGTNGRGELWPLLNLLLRQLTILGVLIMI